MWYKVCICEPRNNKSKVKEGFLEENENRLAFKKESISQVVKMLWIQDVKMG